MTATQSFQCRDIGYGIETGEVYVPAFGPYDWCGKRAYMTTDNTTVYLFDDELVAPEPQPTAIQVGDIFASSWGYDQTNVDYYEVVKVTAKSVQVREIGARIVEIDSVGNERLEPAPGTFKSEPRTKRVRDAGYGMGPCLRMESYETAYLWTGGTNYQTGALNGH